MDLYSTHTSPAPPQSIASSGSPLESQVGELGPGSVYSSATTETRSISDQQTSQPATSASIPAVPAACLACRSKHLKCDGSARCARCVSSGSECVYVASRRGYKGPRRGTAQNPNKRHASSSPEANGGRDIVSASVGVGIGGGGGVSDDVAGRPGASCPMLLGANVAPGLAGTVFPGAGPNIVGVVDGGGAQYGHHGHLFSNNNSSNDDGNTHSNGHQLFRTQPPPFANPLDAVRYGAPLAPATSIADRCLDSFYHHYHAAHPFVLPRPHLQRYMHMHMHAPKTDGGGGGSSSSGSSSSSSSIRGLDALSAAMRYVGSLFVDAGPARATYLDEALRLCGQHQHQHQQQEPGVGGITLSGAGVGVGGRGEGDGFVVQALLLLVVALDGSCEQDRARDLLGEAERLAVEVGLHTRAFAALHGRGDPVLEESWRRTWWDLYVCDGMVAGVHRVTNFLLFDVPADVGLPCEEAEYLSGNIPQPMYMEDFDDQLFTGEDRPFSSFTFRIAAIRNLGRMMRCPPILFPEDENMARLDSHLTNWRLHLPPDKRDPIDKNCAPDEMLFQAHFITKACTIMLHQPHSQLDSSPARSVNACAPYRPTATTGDGFFNNHTRHTVTAARALSGMVTHAVPLHHHTHFFTCVLTMAAIVHLSRWAQYYYHHQNSGSGGIGTGDDDELRGQIRLCIGALGSLSAVWKAAARAGDQVRGVAREIYRAKKAQQINPAFWVAFTQEEMINSLNVDEGVMGEIDSLLSAVSSAPQ